MAGIKISALPASAGAATSDVFPVVQAGVTNKETVSQLITLLNSNLTYLPLAGGTLTGNLILNADATTGLGAVTLNQLNAVATGITVQGAVRLATTGALTVTYSNGTAGVGATLTNADAQAALTLDSVAAALNDRILVKNQATAAQNGIYTVTNIGSGSTNWVLTRATDYDLPSQINPGDLVVVTAGTTLASSSWLETAAQVVTIGTDSISFAQFSAALPISIGNGGTGATTAALALVALGLGTPSGTGNVLLETSPTLITPTLGAAKATSLQFSPSTGGIIGTATNDSPTAGDVGEFVSSVIASGSAVTQLSNAASNLTSISLTAGDWDVWGNVVFQTLGTTPAQIVGWSSLSSATLPDSSLRSVINLTSGIIAGTSSVNILQARYSLSVTTTIYISGFLGNVSGNGTICGGIYARRRR